MGYVATIALFGAEFLMPVYLQAFRGRTALETGYILLAVAATSGIATPLAGRLYDKIGPRMNLIVGFAILCVNTWQLTKIEATTPISYHSLPACLARTCRWSYPSDLFCGCVEQYAAE